MANPPGIRFRESEVQLAPAVVGSSLGAMIGQSSRGRVDKAQLVSSWAEYTELYGGFGDSYDLSLAMWDYLRNGGSNARLVRIAGVDAAQAHSSTGIKAYDGATSPIKIYAADPGAWGNSLSVSIFRKSAVVGGVAQRLTTEGGTALPALAAASHGLAEVVLSSVRDVQIGDVLTAYAGDTGEKVVDLTDALVVLDVDAANKAIRYTLPNVAVPANAVLKSASRHLGIAKATGQLADTATSLAVDSTDGFERGSLVSIFLSSVYDSAAGNLDDASRAVHINAVVDKIVGKTLHFTAAVSLPGVGAAKTLPAVVVAKDAFDAEVAAPNGLAANAACILTATAQTAGAAGNTIILKFVSSATVANAGAVGVVGRTVTLTYKTNVTTAAQLVALLAASTIVRLATDGNGAQVLAAAAGNTLVRTLTGGADLKVVSQEFDIVLKESGVEVEASRHSGLSLQATSTNYIGIRLGGALDATFGFQVPSDSSQSVRIVVGDIGVVASVNALPIAVEDLVLAAGVDGAVATDDEIVGSTAPRKGLYLFDEADDIDLLLAPGFTSALVQQGIIDYAEARADVLALLDMPSDVLTSEDMGVHRSQSLGSSSSYAALYAPYGKMSDPRPSVPRGSLVLVPPTPAVAALMAKRADSQGPHVPAANQELAWAGVSVNLTEAEHGALNDLGINVIKLVRRTGIRLFGARTLSSAVDGRRFSNVRRWLNFMKQSLGSSLQGFVFRPAGIALFADIESAVGRFLSEQWQLGALYPQDRRSSAYFVKCDSETTSSIDLANGVVNCEIGVSPVTPAEHIVFSINVSAGGVRIGEQ